MREILIENNGIKSGHAYTNNWINIGLYRRVGNNVNAKRLVFYIRKPYYCPLKNSAPLRGANFG